jgi:putative Holliday junction resolvase
MSRSKTLLGLDIGEKRIGAAVGDVNVKIAVPYDTIDVDGNEIERIARIVIDESVDTAVVGYPRNQSGEPTAQTAYVEEFAKKLKDIVDHIEFQDESLTSVLAEQQLKSYGQPYSKGDIDARAAVIILQDYLERH